MDLTQLRRTLQSFTTLMLDVYDREGGTEDSELARFAYTHDNRQARANPVRLDHLFSFPEVYDWSGAGQVEFTEIDRWEWSVPMQGWSVFVRYNLIDAGRPSTLVDLQKVVSSLPPAFTRKRFQLAMSVLRGNPISVDGQPFFSDAHSHPAGMGSYDNTQDFEVAALDDETVRDIVEAIYDRFRRNMRIQSEVYRADQVENLLIFVPESLIVPFRRVAGRDLLVTKSGATLSNDVKGRFELLVDSKLADGQIRAVWTDPAGPKPVLHVPDRDPWLDVDESIKLPGQHVAIAMMAIFAAKPLFPQAAQAGTITVNPPEV
ncbi:MAG: hypothetical protein AAGN66_08545 [Acidobacteriota bacterium]